jgi:CRISPR type IV-associated protein Csf3
MLISELWAYFSATIDQYLKLKEIFPLIKAIGKKTAYGHGKVVMIDVERIEEDFSLVKNGHAMRWLPKPNRPRLLRTTPPYWNMINQTSVCEIGEKYEPF